MNDKPVVIPALNSVLDRLAAGEQPLLYQPPKPLEPPQPRSGGRRETRLEVNKSKHLIFQAKGMRDGVTAPIARKQPKRPTGMTAKEWKRARRVARDQAGQDQRREDL